MLTLPDSVDRSGKQSAASAIRDALQEAMATRQRLVIDPGDYLFPFCGADTDSINLDLTGSLDVVQMQGATLRIQCDGDAIRFKERRGLAKGQIIKWRGFAVDQREQFNSSVVPFRRQYRPKKPGDSKTCDAISIRLRDDSAVSQIVFNDYHIDAGEHWQIAGGDSGIFIEGDGVPVFLQRGYMRGSRDLGEYLSKCRTISRFNRYESCFGGTNQKRGGTLRAFRNVYFNCPRAVACDIADDPDAMADVIVDQCSMIQCGIQGRFTNASRAWARDNWIFNPGAKLADGSPETIAGDGRFVFRNVESKRDQRSKVM